MKITLRSRQRKLHIPFGNMLTDPPSEASVIINLFNELVTLILLCHEEFWVPVITQDEVRKIQGGYVAFLCSDSVQFRGRKIAATAAQGGEHPRKRIIQGRK